jgi:hypothetical protein
MISPKLKDLLASAFILLCIVSFFSAAWVLFQI